MVKDDPQMLYRILEGALLSAGEALTVERMQSLFDEDDMPEKAEILEALENIKGRNASRGFELVEVASGWRFQVLPDLAPWINRLWEEKPQKYSRAILETLALIAYRQPITRGDIEEVRGVAVSSHIIKTLAEREWIKVVGHRDVPGRPSLFATTKVFLDYFGLKSLEDLPSLSELKDFDGFNKGLDLQVDEESEQIAEAKEANEAEVSSENQMDDLDLVESAAQSPEEAQHSELDDPLNEAADHDAPLDVASAIETPVSDAHDEDAPVSPSEQSRPSVDEGNSPEILSEDEEK